MSESDTTAPGQPPYDVMSLEDLRWERGVVEHMLEHDPDPSEMPHYRVQLSWYNAAIAWTITNG